MQHVARMKLEAKEAKRQMLEAARSAMKEQQRQHAQEQQRLLREAREAALRQQAPPGPYPADGPSIALEDRPVDELADWVLRDHGGCVYRCLCLAPNADVEVCRKRFLYLVRLLHPDRFPDSRAARAFTAVESAYQTIIHIHNT